MSNENYTDAETKHQKIKDDTYASIHKASVFLKNVASEPYAFEKMTTQLIKLAYNFGYYQSFFELIRREKPLFSNNKTRFEGARRRANVLQAIGAIKNTTNSKEEWLERKKIISNAKFKGTIIPENAKIIKDVDIIVDVTHNDNLKIKAIISPDHPACADDELFDQAVNELLMPTIFRLEKYKSKEFELSIEQMRIQKYTEGKTRKKISCEFHVEKGMLAIPRESNTKMVRVSILGLLSEAASEINFPCGTIRIGRTTFHNRGPVALVKISPPEREKPSNTWHFKSRGILRNSLPLMIFIAAKSLCVSEEEHMHDDRSEFYFEKDIEKHYPILDNHGAQTLLGKVFNASNRDGFVEDTNKLAEALNIANTYSPSWRIRLICMIEALEVWGSHEKFNMLSSSFRNKLNLFFKEYISKDNKEYREELNRVRNNVMHEGKATPEKLKSDEDKDKFYSLKDESKY